jgi:hypothetical protein
MPGPTIPVDQVVLDCTVIYARLKRVADQRSMVHGKLSTYFGSYVHGRTYQGYFRDTLVLMHVDGATYSLDRHQTIDEKWVARARRKRTAHRQNAMLVKYLRSADA